MANLTQTTPLNGFDQPIGNMRLREITDLDITALAIPNNGATKFKAAIKSTYGLSMPSPLKSTADAKTRLLMTQPDQLFALTRRGANTPIDAYITDQTDAWVLLELSGPASRTALERICQIDLDPDAFQKNQMARTTMEHMAAIIIRTGTDTFILMSASSSAASFQHAVELSVKHVS